MESVCKRLVLVSAGIATAVGVFIGVNASDNTDLTINIRDGALNIDIVDSTYEPVADPSVEMEELNFSFSPQTSNGTLGTVSERILLQNPTSTSAWSVTIQAYSGATAEWIGISSGYVMDYNDPAGSSGNGQLIIDASTATAGRVGDDVCTINGGTGNCGDLSLGSASGFVQDITDAITLYSTSIVDPEEAGAAPNYSEYELIEIAKREIGGGYPPYYSIKENVGEL